MYALSLLFCGLYLEVKKSFKLWSIFQDHFKVYTMIDNDLSKSFSAIKTLL